MEFFNDIWSALSTPNEGLMNILSIPLFVIENTLVLFFIIYLLNIKTHKKQKILYVFLTSLESIISIFLISPPYNSIVNYIIIFIINYFLFKMNIIKTILSVILPTIVFGLISTLVFNPFIKAINVEPFTALIIPLYRIAFIFITHIILLYIILLLKNKNIYLNILEELDKKSKKILILNLSLGFIVLIIHLILIVYYTTTLPIIISLLSFISLLAYFSVNIYSLTKTNQFYLTSIKLQNAEEYNKTLQILHDNIRGFKHDYDNTVSAIGGYIQTNDMDGLKKYYSQLEEECLKVNELYMLNPNIINNPGIYSLLTTKYNKAEELGIKMNLTVLLDFSTINMKIYEFTKILGILIDNAIDASKESDEKTINILFKYDKKNNRQILLIENSYLEKNVDLDKIFEKGKTSKENHTGLGLWEVRKILKRNNNLNLHTTKDNTFFKQQFEIYNI